LTQVPEEPKVADAEAARKIQHFATRLIRLARTDGKTHAISSAQYSAMALIAEHPGISVVELARLERVAHPTMSRLVTGLEKAGLTARVKDPTDRRSSLLSLSELGEKTYHEAAARRIALFQMLLAKLTPATVEDVLKLVERGTGPLEQTLAKRQFPR
jgi:DNA-binding MarR family transcriptional regulator